MAEKPHVNLGAFYTALDARRRTNGLSWREVSLQALGHHSASLFTRIAAGKPPSLANYVLLCDWLGHPADAFIDRNRPTEREAREIVSKVRCYLKRDRADADSLLAVLPSLEETARVDRAAELRALDAASQPSTDSQGEGR